ncbi:glycine betaine ABC transporter substrate-binding protein [Mycolicibacterium conceptionense]|uniref:Glycine betaine ABC transporter substrate-binding protein n=1 Tax=Mycolicibacterium conceptionense TaxID=451644 RepID=A0A0U1CX76_9MYCO|nr:glycine betaine ABC transporter substrate-binding protein [Mycolicibacterium conceptionense]
MRMTKLFAVLAAATVALAGCAVDHSGENSQKPTIRLGYQSFPSGDLIVKNNKWLEERCPTTTSSGPSSTPGPT